MDLYELRLAQPDWGLISVHTGFLALMYRTVARSTDDSENAHRPMPTPSTTTPVGWVLKLLGRKSRAPTFGLGDWARASEAGPVIARAQPRATAPAATAQRRDRASMAGFMTGLPSRRRTCRW